MRTSTLLLVLLLVPACREKGDDSGSIDSEVVDSQGDTAPTDADGDGHGALTDCDDGDAAINPDAEETCDGIDNNCDGTIDEDDATDASTWYADTDADGYGDAATTRTACDQPVDHVSNDTDCDDSDPRFHPGAAEGDCADPADYNCDGSVGYEDVDADGFPACEDCDDGNSALSESSLEICDGLDNDCDGSIDEEDSIDAATWYLDADSDGHGSTNLAATACDQPPGFVDNSDDCNDLNAAAYPGATETCDGVDNDCDGVTDEDDATDTAVFYADSDGDGYGSPNYTTNACEQPSGFVENADDCNDLDAAVYPGAAEVCDSVDNDCDGSVDEDSSTATTWYADADGDGYGSAAYTTESCTQPTGYVADATDCNDLVAAANPGASEICDGVDNDCDGGADDADPEGASGTSTWYFDADSDGYGTTQITVPACAQPTGYVADATDCDDNDVSIHPWASEYCDSTDSDCDGEVSEDDSLDASTWYADSDADGFGDAATTTAACSQPAAHVADATDCDDTSNTTYPGADDYCDNTDSNCDGEVSEDDSVDASTWYADTDSDNYGDASSSVSACTQPAAHVADATDCDDATNTTYPGADDYCDNTDSNCDGEISEDDSVDASTWYADTDSDNYGDATATSSACSQPTGYLADATDCDDSTASVYPGATEVCDGNDTDCDGTADSESGISACLYGDGRDGSVSVSGTAYIQAEILGSTRSGGIADGIATQVTADPTGTDISVSSSSGFATGDLAMLINLQGGSGDVADVGSWEVLQVDSIPSSTTVAVTQTPGRTYAGSAFSSQKVLLQRLPQWTNVTISGTLTANAWDGSSGGILAFLATGTVNVTGTVDMDQKGYRGGAGLIGTGWATDGEGRTGPGSTCSGNNTAGCELANDNGGGGSYGDGGYYNANSGGGSYGTRDTDTPGNQAGNSTSGISGDVIGDANLSQLNFGGGAGGCMAHHSASPTDGGDGGGIILIRADTLSVNGIVRTDGQDGYVCSGSDPSNVSAGAGGAIYLVANTMTLGTTVVTAYGGSKSHNTNNGYGGGGGDGRIRLEYSTLNSTSHPNTAAEEDAAAPDPGSSATPGG